MGSTLEGETSSYKFDILVNDPDVDQEKDMITKIDIVKDAGAVAAEYEVNPPAYSVKWEPTIEDSKSKYFFVRVWNAGGGDAPQGDAKKPTSDH